MKSKKILNIALISVLLSSMAIGAEESACTGGVCFATLANIKPRKVIEDKKSACVGDACFVTLSNSKSLKTFEDKQKNNQIESIEEEKVDSDIAIDIEKKSKVVSIETYTMEEEAFLDSQLVLNPMEATDDKILEKIDLPSSEYFCDNDKQPVYLNDDTYECV